jgi:CheY-like chemotaxis protein/anti-sigma regulatory factor (Ser/Thr protein kinase)
MAEGNRPKRVLVVEDDDGMRRVLVEALSRDGSYVPVEASDAEKGLAEFGRDRPQIDAAIVDLHLPGIQGDELVARMRALSPSTAVIVITAYRNDEAILKCLESGAADYLTKPLDLAALERALERAMKSRVHLAPGDRDVDVREPARGWVELTAPSDVEYVERFRAFTEVLLATDLAGKAKEDVRIAVDEIGTNAVEWGNRGDRSKKIRISYCLFDDRIVFKIEDEGEGFDPRALDDPSVDPLAHIMRRLQSGKRAGGYGIHITKNVMDEVIYSDRGNVVLLTKFLKPRTGG